MAGTSCGTTVLISILCDGPLSALLSNGAGSGAGASNMVARLVTVAVWEPDGSRLSCFGSGGRDGGGTAVVAGARRSVVGEDAKRDDMAECRETVLVWPEKE